MTNLYLVGTIHVDPKGPERLEKFLDFTRPSAICVEASERSYRETVETIPMLQRDAAQLQNWLRIHRSFGMMSVPLPQEILDLPPGPQDILVSILKTAGFEDGVPHNFQREYSRVEIIPQIDEATASDGQDLWREILQPEKGSVLSPGLKAILGLADDIGGFSQRVDKQYFVENEYEGASLLRRLGGVVSDMNGQYGPGIRRAVQQFQDKTVVVVGGVDHFYGHVNVFDKLRDFNPHRLRLCEVDEF